MNWKFWKKRDRERLLDDVTQSLVDAGKRPFEVEQMKKLSNILHDGDQELADANLIAVAETITQDPNEWGPDELGVESLYLPFGVRKGWADGPIDPGGIEDPVTEVHQRKRGEFTGEIAEPVHWSCNQLLYQRLDAKREDGSEILRPSFCKLNRGHKGKHGLPDVEYLHPDEYPHRVGIGVPSKSRVDEIKRHLFQLSNEIEALITPTDL